MKRINLGEDYSKNLKGRWLYTIKSNKWGSRGNHPPIGEYVQIVDGRIDQDSLSVKDMSGKQCYMADIRINSEDPDFKLMPEGFDPRNIPTSIDNDEDLGGRWIMVLKGGEWDSKLRVGQILQIHNGKLSDKMIYVNDPHALHLKAGPFETKRLLEENPAFKLMEKGYMPAHIKDTVLGTCGDTSGSTNFQQIWEENNKASSISADKTGGTTYWAHTTPNYIAGVDPISSIVDHVPLLLRNRYSKPLEEDPVMLHKNKHKRKIIIINN